MPRRARCFRCRRLFYPDPRCKHPKACKDPECQRERQYASHKIWRDKDPEVIKDRRETSRNWRRTHSGHMQDYRLKHADYVERNRQQQRGQRLAKRVVVSISTSPQVVDKYNEFIRSLPVVVSTSIANCPAPGLQGMP